MCVALASGKLPGITVLNVVCDLVTCVTHSAQQSFGMTVLHCLCDLRSSRASRLAAHIGHGRVPGFTPLNKGERLAHGRRGVFGKAGGVYISSNKRVSVVALVPSNTVDP